MCDLDYCGIEILLLVQNTIVNGEVENQTRTVGCPY